MTREHELVQVVRLADVLFVGPLLLWAAVRIRRPPALRVALTVTGWATILYNGARFLTLERERTL